MTSLCKGISVRQKNLFISATVSKILFDYAIFTGSMLLLYYIPIQHPGRVGWWKHVTLMPNIYDFQDK